MHCLRVFRSSVPSDLLPSSPGRRPSWAAQGECGSTRSTEWGVGPGGAVSYRRCRPAGKSPAGLIGEGMLPGPVRSQGRVARAQRAATRLETAREQWRAPHGLAVAPGQPVVSYVGYSLKEPWGSPGSSSGSTPMRRSTSPSSPTGTNARGAGSLRSGKPHSSRSPISRGRFNLARCSRSA